MQIENAVFLLADPRNPTAPFMMVTRQGDVEFAADFAPEQKLWAVTRALLDCNDSVNALAKKLDEMAPEMFAGNELVENTPESNEQRQLLADLIAASEAVMTRFKRLLNSDEMIDLKNETEAAKVHLGRA